MFDGEKVVSAPDNIFVLLSVAQDQCHAVRMQFQDVSLHENVFPQVGFSLVGIQNHHVARPEIRQEVFFLCRNVQFDEVVSFAWSAALFLQNGQSQQDVASLQFLVQWDVPVTGKPVRGIAVSSGLAENLFL